jgi:hypothetical protein
MSPLASIDRKGYPTPLSVQQMSCVVLVQIAEGLNSKHTLVRGPVVSYMYLTYLPT